MTIVVQRFVWTKMHFFVLKKFSFDFSLKSKILTADVTPLGTTDSTACKSARRPQQTDSNCDKRKHTETNYQYDFAVKLWSSKPLKT